MRDLMVLGIHLLVTLARLVRPGGVRAVAAESLILKHQLVIVGRSRRRAPNLTSFDRVASISSGHGDSLRILRRGD